MAAPKARQRFCGQARRASTFLLVAALAAHLSTSCAADSGSNLLRRLLQTGTGASTASQAAGAGGSAAGNNDFVGAAQQTFSSANAQQAGNVAAKQLVSSATGNLPINSNDLNTLIQGVRATQTFGQYLATLAGEANKQTSLQSTLQGQNIAGLYKQQTTDERFKVGSPSGSIYWTAGNEPVPAPAQAVAVNFANALAPSVNSLTNSLMELIPSPPPPPPPPTVIQALAPLEQAATQRIADILTTSGQAAAANSGSGAGTARDGTSSFQQQPAQQQGLPTIAVPTTFTHDTWNAENYGRRLLQQQWMPTQQQQQQQASGSQQNWAPPQQQQAAAPTQQWAPTTQAQQSSQQKWDSSTSNANNWAPSSNGQQWTPSSQEGTGTQQKWDASGAAANNWSPSNQQWAPQQQQWAPQVAATTQARSADQTVNGSPINPQVQRADGSWAPAQQQQQQQQQTSTDRTTAVANTNTQGADATRSEVAGTGQPSQYGASSTNNQGSAAAAATTADDNGQGQAANAAAPSPAPSALSFPPVTINGVNLPGWSLPTWSPAPPLGPVPALAPLPLAPQPMPLPGQPQPAATASFQELTNEGVPLTQALAQQSALPQLQVIGGAPAARPNTNLPAQPAGPVQPGLPGFPPPNGPVAVPNNNLVWVGLGGSGKQT